MEIALFVWGYQMRSETVTFNVVWEELGPHSTYKIEVERKCDSLLFLILNYSPANSQAQDKIFSATNHYSLILFPTLPKISCPGYGQVSG